MKKTVLVVIFALLLSLGFSGCGLTVARPEVKEGRFHISLTYEHNGAIKTASGVYVCEYDGVVWYNVDRDPFVKWKESFEGDIRDGGVLPIGNTEDGGEIVISLLLHPEYFMGDPAYAEATPRIRAELLYEDRQIDDAQILAEYGVRLIDCEYDAPIENTYQ